MSTAPPFSEQSCGTLQRVGFRDLKNGQVASERWIATMSSRPLPTKLGKEPLIEVLCAVHFSSDAPAESLLPGVLLSKLSDKKPSIETLGAAQLPQFVRDNDPNLQNAPLMKIMLDQQHFILIGSRWIAVGCQESYPGWSAYKREIESVFSVLNDAGFINGVERYSLKYVDFIKSQDAPSGLEAFNLKIELAGIQLDDEQIQLRVEIPDEPFIHGVSVVSKANLSKPGQSPISGALLDVDTHRVYAMSTADFHAGLSDLLDEIHAANKRIFFDLLSESGLHNLEPVYA